jgi:hypothetical protein
MPGIFGGPDELGLGLRSERYIETKVRKATIVNMSVPPLRFFPIWIGCADAWRSGGSAA